MLLASSSHNTSMAMRNVSPYETLHDQWRASLPDGSHFNHWGGQSVSEWLIGLLDVAPSHSVLDVCCGEGGTLSLLPPVTRKYGIDSSLRSIKECRRTQREGEFVCGDAHELPFKDEFFDRIFAQDADVWMQGDSLSVLKEISRVLTHEGRFVLQNYVQASTMPSSAITKTQEILGRCGFTETGMLILENLRDLFSDAGLLISASYDLHAVYTADNLRMIRAARASNSSQTLKNLFDWESLLFERRWWTGVAVVAQRSRRSSGQS